MDAIGAAHLIKLFEAWRRVFAEQRDFLISLDGKVGDSDLGITMSKAFAAAHDAVVAEEEGASISKLLRTAGAIMAKAAPSTMGTLTATGFLRAAKAAEGADALGTSEVAAFWRAFSTGVAERGKARIGDKTVLDVLAPIAEGMEDASAKGLALGAALSIAVLAAIQALEGTKSMVAQHGKAAAFQAKTVGLQDAGATVGLIIVQTMRDFVMGTSRVV